jgi:CBS domain-containing protein
VTTQPPGPRTAPPETPQVKDVIKGGVTAVRPGASVTEAARLMRDQNVGDVLVADGDRVVGVLTDRDLTVRVLADHRDPEQVSAGSVCSGDPLVVGPHDTAEHAASLMREHAVHRLPVVEDGRPVGVVTLGDLRRHAV